MSWVCEVCGRPPADVLTCDSAERPEVVPYSRVLVDEPWWSWRRWLLMLPERCRGCGVAEGGTHHVGCVVARCAIHGGQRLDCECNELGGEHGAP